MRLKKYLLEESEKGKIYFGHSRIYYHSDKEAEAKKIIQAKFPGYKILDPSGPKHDAAVSAIKKKVSGAEMKYFVKLCDTADIGCFLVKNLKKCTTGSAIEILRILQKGKPAYLVDLAKKKLVKILKKDVKKISIKDTDKELREKGLDHLIVEGIIPLLGELNKRTGNHYCLVE